MSPRSASALNDDILAIAVAIPPPPEAAGLYSRVEHLIAHRTDHASILISEALQVPIEDFILPLMRFGAIFTCPVAPIPPNGKASPVLLEARQAAMSRLGKHGSMAIARRMNEDGIVEKDAYIRVHMHPKRFPLFYQVAWKDRIVAHTEEYVVVDKPGGVPVVPTVDNLIECVPAGAAQALGLPRLLSTHRLDQATEGLVVLGQTPAFVAQFHALMRQGTGIRKWYRCLTANEVQSGKVVHKLVVGVRSPGLPSHTIAISPQDEDEQDRHIEGDDDGTESRSIASSFKDVIKQQKLNTVHAELIVLHSRQVTLTGEAAQLFGDVAWESELELITGRTHQIRAQLSALGCPLLGDDLYTPLADETMRMLSLKGQLGLKLNSVHKANQDTLDSSDRGNDGVLGLKESSSGRILAESVGRIGLQSYKLQVDSACMAVQSENIGTHAEHAEGDDVAVFTAGTPWWRT